MGAPEEIEKFECYTIDGLTIYVNEEILQDLKENITELLFSVEGYGTYKLPLDKVDRCDK